MVEITIRGRLAFPSLWEPSSVNNGPEKYRARIIIDPSDPWGKKAVRAIDAARDEVAKAKWKGKAAGIMEANKGDKNKETWFKSDYRSSEGEVLDGFEGMYHLSTLSDGQPTIIDADRTELTKRDGRPYSGCYCVFKVDIWPQDNSNGKALRAQLMGVQFWKDGPGFGGGGKKAKADEFEDLSAEDDEDEDTPRANTSARRPRDEDEDEPAPKPKKRAPPPEDDDDY